MAEEDKVVEVPQEEDKQVTTPAEANVEEKSESEVAIPVKKLDPKYEGKSIEEIIEMHRNAESLASRKSQELAELKKRESERPKPTIDEVAKLFVTEPTLEDDFDAKEVKNLKANQIAQRFEMDVLKARLDKSSMPEWERYEGRVLEMAKSRPYFLCDPNWTHVIYKLVESEELPIKLQEAEERGKKTMKDKEIPKIEATVIGEPSPAKAPPPPPEPTFNDIREQYRKGKITLAEFLKTTMTDAERGK